MKNIENIENINVQYSHVYVEKIRTENRALREELTRFKRYVNELESRLEAEHHKVIGLKADNRMLTVERNNLLKAELLAEQHEVELVSALGSFMGDD